MGLKAMPKLAAAAVFLALAAAPGAASDYNYSVEERIALIRDLTAEFATAKMTVPRSKKPLPFDAGTGQSDLEKWSEANQKHGPAVRLGDMIQITRVKFEKKRLVFEINGGFKGGRKWYERIQVGGGMGGGGTMTPVGRGSGQPQQIGTNLALEFPDGLPELDAGQVKELLNPLFDFELRSATEQFIETLPEPQQAAIEEQRAIEGMDQDAVLLAMGKPERKIRETKDGIEYEDWVYGTPPGTVTFVTFRGSKVVKVRESFAGLGGTVAAPLPPR